jgi:hypothetical protein
MSWIDALDSFQADLAGAILIAMTKGIECRNDSTAVNVIRGWIIDVVSKISPDQVEEGINIFYNSVENWVRRVDVWKLEEWKSWYCWIALRTL